MEVLIVGCGISGAVIARELAEKGKKVVIWEQRGAHWRKYVRLYR